LEKTMEPTRKQCLEMAARARELARRLRAANAERAPDDPAALRDAVRAFALDRDAAVLEAG